MDSRLKQRLIGAAVLVALAVIFLPMLVQGPAPDSGVSDVPLSVPDAPRGDYATRDLPLVTPGTAPAGGAVGMGPGHAAQEPVAATPSGGAPSGGAPSSATPSSGQPTPLESASQPLAGGAAPSITAAPLPLPKTAVDAMLPAPTAGGDYAVGIGTFPVAAAGDALVRSLRAAQLPGYAESAIVDGKPVSRVRIGPYASRADAEAARLRAAHVPGAVGARVIALDAHAPATPSSPVSVPAGLKTAPPAVAKAATKASLPPAKPVDAPQPAPGAAAGTGFAIQLAAFSKSDDASALRDRLRAAGFTAFTESVATDKGTLTRVRVGPVLTRADADQLKAQVKAKLGLDGIVRPHP